MTNEEAKNLAIDAFTEFGLVRDLRGSEEQIGVWFDIFEEGCVAALRGRHLTVPEELTGSDDDNDEAACFLSGFRHGIQMFKRMLQDNKLSMTANAIERSKCLVGVPPQRSN